MRRGPFVEGYKAIAAHCGRSERWVRNFVRRAKHPLPAAKVGGVFRLYLADFDAWVAEEMAGDAVAREGDPDALGW